MFLRVHFTMFQLWFRWWLGTDKVTIHYLNQWCSSLLSHIELTMVLTRFSYVITLRHNEHNGVTNHQHLNCLCNSLFGSDQRKHQSSASLAFERGIHWWLVDSPPKGPVMRKMFPFDDIIMFWAHRRTKLLRSGPNVCQFKRGIVICILSLKWRHMATWNWVNIGWGNGLLPDGTKPLPEPMLTHNQWDPLTITWKQIHKR